MTRPDLRAGYRELRRAYANAVKAASIHGGAFAKASDIEEWRAYDAELLTNVRDTLAALDAFMERHLFGREPDGWVIEYEPGKYVDGGDYAICVWRNRAKAEQQATWQRELDDAWDGIGLVPVYIGTAPVPEHTEQS